MHGTDVTVVLQARGDSALLPMSLAHLEVQTFPAGRFEVVVVDQSESQETRRVLARYAESAPVRTRWYRCPERGAAAARNLGVEHATGVWVVFLDEDLLARPTLVERHVQEQKRHGGECAIRGSIKHHPQVDPRVLTRWYELPPAVSLQQDQPLRFLDWRAFNLSLPRQAIMEAGGFDERPNLDGAEDLDLAWRLEQGGMPGFFSDKAPAFTWRPTTVESEMDIYYGLGYALHGLLERTASDILRQRYRPFLSRRQAMIDAFVSPIFGSIASQFAATSSFFAAFCHRTLRHALWQGHRDAIRGRPRRQG
jgi:glycosyltransferase involved in cell wall biosynthesis